MSHVHPAAHRARRRRALALVLVFAGHLAAAEAWAQSPAAIDRLSAEALFDDGLRLMQTHDFVAACPKLEASYRLDPGIGTLLYLADCYAATGRIASAWISFREAAFEAKKATQPEREQAALERAESLESKLTSLRLLMVSPAADLALRLDGHLLEPSMIGVSMPVDPGPHTLEASAPGRLPWRQTLSVVPKPGLITMTIPQLAAAPPAPVANKPEDRGSPHQEALGWIGVGLGAAALVGASAALGAGVEPWPGPVAIGGAGLLCFTGGAVLLLTLPSDSTGAAKASGRQALGIGWQSRF